MGKEIKVKERISRLKFITNDDITNIVRVVDPLSLILCLSAVIMISGLIIIFTESVNSLILVLTLFTAISFQVIGNISYSFYVFNKFYRKRLNNKRIVTKKIIERILILFIFISIVLFIIFSIVVIQSNNLDNILIFIGIGIMFFTLSLNYGLSKLSYGGTWFGDLIVGLVFITIVLGSVYLQIGNFQISSVLAATGFGLLSTAVYNLRNMCYLGRRRSILNDLGEEYSRLYHACLIVLALILLTFFFVYINSTYIYSYIFLLTLPAFLWHLFVVMLNKDKTVLRLHIGLLIIFIFILSVLFFEGLYLYHNFLINSLS